MIDVSIIIPIYNRANTLTECLKSITKVRQKNYEIILVDDGSTDNSASICQDFCKEHSEAHYYYKNNGGVSSARNFGISKAQGKWITFIDSDDTIRPEHLDIVQYESNKQVDWLIESFSNTYKNNVEYCLDTQRIESSSPAIYYFTDFFKTNTPMFSVCGKFYKLDICKSYHIFFREDIHLGEDQIFNLEYLHHVNRLVHYPRMSTYIQSDLIITGEGKRLSSKVLPLNEYYYNIVSNYQAFRSIDKQANSHNICFSINHMVTGMATLTLINYQRKKCAKNLHSGELLSFTKNKVRPLFQSVLPYRKAIKEQHINIIYSLIVTNHCRLALSFCFVYSRFRALYSYINKLLTNYELKR